MYPSTIPFTQVTGWDLANENDTLKLHRSWRVKSFTKGLDFFKRVADIAESEGKQIISSIAHVFCDLSE